MSTCLQIMAHQFQTTPLKVSRLYFLTYDNVIVVGDFNIDFSRRRRNLTSFVVTIMCWHMEEMMMRQAWWHLSNITNQSFAVSCNAPVQRPKAIEFAIVTVSVHLLLPHLECFAVVLTRWLQQRKEYRMQLALWTIFFFSLECQTGWNTVRAQMAWIKRRRSSLCPLKRNRLEWGSDVWEQQIA